jgi:hypothetical protein
MASLALRCAAVTAAGASVLAFGLAAWAMQPAPETTSKAAVFNLIAEDARVPKGSDSWPERPFVRWETAMHIKVLPWAGHKTEAEAVTTRVLVPLLAEIAAMDLPGFHGAKIEPAESQSNVILLIGDDLDLLLKELPNQEDPVWSRLAARMLELYGPDHALRCGRVVAKAGPRIVAGLIYISTRPIADDPRVCAGAAFADVIGLRGAASAESSVKASRDTGHWRPLDRDALRVLYGTTALTYRRVDEAVDAFFRN